MPVAFTRNTGKYWQIMGNTGKYDLQPSTIRLVISIEVISLNISFLLVYQAITAKTRSDRDKLCHFWSKMKLQESQNKLFLSIASYLVHLILEGFC